MNSPSTNSDSSTTKHVVILLCDVEWEGPTEELSEALERAAQAIRFRFVAAARDESPGLRIGNVIAKCQPGSTGMVSNILRAGLAALREKFAGAA